jgi:adenosylcobyric acid synthase
MQGLFEAQGACAALLRWAGLRAPLQLDHAERRERMLDRLADTLEQPLALERFVRLG